MLSCTGANIWHNLYERRKWVWGMLTKAVQGEGVEAPSHGSVYLCPQSHLAWLAAARSGRSLAKVMCCQGGLAGNLNLHPILCLAVPFLPRERKVRSCRCISSAASRLRQRVMHVAGRWQGTPYGKSLAPGTLHGLRSSATSSEPCCMNMDLLLVMKVSSIDLKEMCWLPAALVYESWPPLAWNLANSSSQLTPLAHWATC